MNKFVLATDVDETLRPGDSIFDLFECFGKLDRGNQVYEWSKNAPQRITEEFGVPVNEVSPGMDVELVLEEIRRGQGGTLSTKEFENIGLNCSLYAGVDGFFSKLKNELTAVRPFLVTTGYSPTVKALAKRLKINPKNIGATELVEEKGRIMGFRGPVMEGEKKAEYVCGLSKKLCIPLSNFIGIGDSKYDAPFLQAIGRAGGLVIAVKPNPLLVQGAKNRLLLEKPDFEKIFVEVKKFVEEKR